MKNTGEDVRASRAHTAMKNTRTPGGRILPAAATPEEGYEAMRGSAALMDRSERVILRLTGRDPFGMLSAILTNDIPKDDDTGAYAALLTPKGRVQTDLRVLKTGNGVLIDTEPEGSEQAREILGRYAPFSRVTIEDLSGEWGVLGLYGPRAGELADLSLAEHQTATAIIGHNPLLAAGVSVPVPGLELIGPLDELRPAATQLLESGAVTAPPEAYEIVRVAAGIPRFGTDITPDNFPGESASFLGRAVSFGKGCYPGQETVARMHYRGHPNRTLNRLTLDGPAPSPGAEITQSGKQVGWISSVAPLRMDCELLALGYISRNADPNGPPLISGSTAIQIKGTS